MVLAYLSSTSSGKSSSPTTWVRQTISTSLSTIRHPSKVSSLAELPRRKLRERSAEFKDDSEIIPRSSSVVVKRLPAVRPGRGKASMYVNGVGATHMAQEPAQKTGASVTPTWGKGAMSKRFDVKEEPSKISAVCS